MTKTEKIHSRYTVIVAALALAVSVIQVIFSQNHNRAAVTPYFTARPSLEGPGGENGIYIGNAGLGPGIIQAAELSVGGRRYDITYNSWPEIFTEIGVEPNCFSQSWLPKGAALRVGEEKALITVTRANTPVCYYQLTQLLTENTFELKIDYMSMYDDKRKLADSISLSELDVNLLDMVEGAMLK